MSAPPRKARSRVRILDSRRLTGPSLLLDGPGAVLEVALHGLDSATAIERWKLEARLRLVALGWNGSALAARAHPAGATLALTAPADALYAATEVNEAAWHAVARALGGDEAAAEARGHGHGDTLEDLAADGDDDPTPEIEIERLRQLIAAERRPELEALEHEAARRGVTFLSDDRRVSVGLGEGSRTWPVEEIPASSSGVPWSEVRDVPVALVTGTNGKSTTVRLLGAMARAAGVVAGVTSTDRVTIGDQVVAEGDYSGPNGARTVLRDRRVQAAILELARGGILRRGLGVPRARVALVTNVANDHLGEFGIFDLAALADVKMVVAKAVGAGGRLVLNADDPLLLERGLPHGGRVTWFTLDPAHAAVARHVAAGHDAALLEEGTLVLARGGRRETLARVAEVPIAFGGAARYNLANALGAIGVAAAMDLPLAAIRSGLTSFSGSAAENPGRGNLWRIAGVTVIVDFAHNPHGLEALAQMAGAIPARRRAIVIGQAGDRDDAAIRAFAAAAWAMKPDRVFIKEMEGFRRGRAEGEVPALIAAGLMSAGASSAALEHSGTEIESVRAALAWAREGDVLLLTTHDSRDAVIGLMESITARGWSPGQPVPEVAASAAAPADA